MVSATVGECLGLLDTVSVRLTTLHAGRVHAASMSSNAQRTVPSLLASMFHDHAYAAVGGVANKAPHFLKSFADRPNPIIIMHVPALS